MAAKRIRFIVTGDLERAAMVPSLSRFFPDATWEGEPVEWLKPQKVHGTTTHRLTADRDPSNLMRALARAALAERLDGADGTPADLVVVIDDLELHNLDQPDVVCAHFRSAMETEVERREQRERSAKLEQRVRDHVRDGCSFHLVAPMVESYLFGDHQALVRVGCTPDVEPMLVDPDLERFESADEAWRPFWERRNAEMHAEPQPMPWWREQCHPKHYLEHLVARNDGRPYDEVPDGARAFSALAWPTVPHDASATSFARALFEDLALFFGVTNPLGPGVTASLTWPTKTIDRRALLLRNM